MDVDRPVPVIAVEHHAAIENRREALDGRLVLAVRQPDFFEQFPDEIDGGLGVGRRFRDLPTRQLIGRQHLGRSLDAIQFGGIDQAFRSLAPACSPCVPVDRRSASPVRTAIFTGNRGEGLLPVLPPALLDLSGVSSRTAEASRCRSQTPRPACRCSSGGRTSVARMSLSAFARARPQ